KTYSLIGNCGKDIKIATIDIQAIAGTLTGIISFNKMPTIQQANRINMAGRAEIGLTPCPTQLLSNSTIQMTANRYKDCHTDKIDCSGIFAPKSVCVALVLSFFLNLLVTLYKNSVNGRATNK